MGCINSKKELREIQSNSNRLPNVYRVFACRISADSGTAQSGYLELSPKELTFSPEVGEQVRWALQHLRRYGCTGDVFSFEAGRRCMTGPGIYTFRCNNAESMHQLFQSYINTVARNDEIAPMLCTDFPASMDLISNSHDTYLEPTSASSSVLYNRAILVRRDSAQSSPLSSNLNSPNSFQGGVNFTNEVIHLNSQSNKHMYPNSNVYQEFPIKPNEYNNNIPKKSPHDVPPQEPAPNAQTIELDSLHPRKYLPLSTTNDEHMYENVNGLEKSESSERCYENFSSIDLPILMNEKNQKTPTNENGAVVNYITLDLVQSPTSTDSFSLKLKSNTTEAVPVGTATTFNVYNKKDNETVNCIPKVQEYIGNNNLHLRTTSELSNTAIGGSSDNQLSTSMGYSTIDFIKTCALIKSVIPPCDSDCQESRITRHSTCVLKNSSLSE